MRMVVINADDFGISQSVNDAIEECFRKKYINQTTLMVNMPYTEDAVGKAFSCGFDDKVGLHLNLIEGMPLTEEIKKTELCDDIGAFNGNIMKQKKNRFLLKRRTRKALKIEIEAQIKKYLQYGFQLKHIDSHEHSHTNWSVLWLLLSIVRKFGFKSIRLSRNIPQEEIKGMKKYYKIILNTVIMKFNSFEANYRNVHYFGSMMDYIHSKGLIGEEQEIMLHPIKQKNGRVVDVIYGIDIAEWEKENQVCVYEE